MGLNIARRMLLVVGLLLLSGPATAQDVLDSAEVRKTGEAVADWQLRYPGRYVVKGRTRNSDPVELVLLGDGTVVGRREAWESVRPPSRPSDVPTAWAEYIAQATQPDLGLVELPAPVRAAAERELGDVDLETIEVRTVYDPRGWEMGALYAGTVAWGALFPESPYWAAMQMTGTANGWRLGDRTYVADDHAVGQMYLAMYARHRRAEMIRDLQLRFEWILNHPPDQGIEWAEGINRWTWSDALFMAPPVWTELATLTGDQRYLGFMNAEWWATTEHLYDEEAHFYYRDDRFFEEREPNGEKVFWSRGNGWAIAGLVRVLERLPQEHPDRPRYLRLYREMAGKLASIQPEDGLWRPSLLAPRHYPTPETSGSGFFCYALAWGINRGLLDRATYLPVVQRAWRGLVSAVDAGGKLGWVQLPGDRPVQTSREETTPYGVGAFLLAASEVYRLAR